MQKGCLAYEAVEKNILHVGRHAALWLAAGIGPLVTAGVVRAAQSLAALAAGAALLPLAAGGMDAALFHGRRGRCRALGGLRGHGRRRTA